MGLVDKSTADKALGVQTKLNRMIEAARKDETLTPVGKQRRIAAAYSAASAEMQQLQATHEQNTARTVTNLQRQLFGAGSANGADAISMRDAADRADRIESPDEAAALLARSENNGDHVLARAIAAKAFGTAASSPLVAHHWVPVVEQFAATRPEAANQMNALLAATRNDAQTVLTTAGTFYMSTPSELSRLSADQVDSLAEAQ